MPDVEGPAAEAVTRPLPPDPRLPRGQPLSRVVIENVSPEVDGGRFAVKRTQGDNVVVEANIFCDGHDAVAAVLCHRAEQAADWTETPMEELGNDRFRASFPVEDLGRYRYCIKAWVDPFETWSRALARRLEAGQDVGVDLLIGAGLVEQAAGRAKASDAIALRRYAASLKVTPRRPRAELGLQPELKKLMDRYPDRCGEAVYDRRQAVVVDPVRARFSSWYELFPRSWSLDPSRHGTFADVEGQLDYVAGMGFDVLYLPPIHPIGRSFRKGRNNSLQPRPDDPGSPWAIGSSEGGHKDINPQLGTADDFRRLVRSARKQGIEVALDLAFQCSPDHPYVREHPKWFRTRPDGTVQYAENPPKKYQDIIPFDFESPDWPSLWLELLSIVEHWIAQGVIVFRVDNPHTKPFRFWEWLIAEVKRVHPEVVFLSEAFTRPRVMDELARVGFTQSYTYFAWRNTASELREYFTELTEPRHRDYFRPNLWPNTPDILTEYLQRGGRAAFRNRLLLAATLGASYGIYGPAFELCEDRPLQPGREEYLDSEKYEVRHWNLEQPASLRELIARVNRVRREHPALQRDDDLRFHGIDNGQILAYSKRSPDDRDIVLTVVNLDPRGSQRGWLYFPPQDAAVGGEEQYQVRDLLNDATYTWSGTHHYIELNPAANWAHLFVIRRGARREVDFEFFA
jgi:starch synthase (maltosyl-transferring)